MKYAIRVYNDKDELVSDYSPLDPLTALETIQQTENYERRKKLKELLSKPDGPIILTPTYEDGFKDGFAEGYTRGREWEYFF